MRQRFLDFGIRAFPVRRCKGPGAGEDFDNIGNGSVDIGNSNLQAMRDRCLVDQLGTA